MQGRRGRNRRQSRLLRIVLTLALGTVLLPLTTVSPPPPPPIPYPVYFLGDSITAGRAATLPRYTYRERLVADLRRDKRRNVMEMGRWGSGWRAANTLGAVDADPPSANTAVIVVEIGTNDVSGNLVGTNVTNPATFDAEYSQLIAEIQSAAPSATFVCLSVWWPAQAAIAYNATIARDCPGGHYADITSMFADSAFHGPAGVPENWYFAHWTTDTFHPNDAAMAAIAQLIETWLV